MGAAAAGGRPSRRAVGGGLMLGRRFWVPFLPLHDKEECSRQNGGAMRVRFTDRATTLPPLVPRLLSVRLPVFYGWVVLGCLCCAGFARQGPAVASLSVFFAPVARRGRSAPAAVARARCPCRVFAGGAS